MRPELVDDFLGVPKLLGREVGVIQNPVVCLSKFVFASQQVGRVFHQLEHLITPFNAPGVFLNTGIRKVYTGQINGLQKILDTAAELDLELAAHLLHR